MAMMLQGGPFKAPVAGFRRFTVPEYHKLIEIGVLNENDRLELLEGYLVEKMPQDPIHAGTIQLVEDSLLQVAPDGWCGRVQLPVTLGQSEPEPDFVLVRGHKRSYLSRHPDTTDIGLVVEVSNTTLDTDRSDKLPIYARAGIPVYWIVNVVGRQIEVYEQPSGLSAVPVYTATRTYSPGDAVPVVLAGQTVAHVLVVDLLK